MFEKINISNCSFNPFETIEKKWMLVTAGTIEDLNTMTASWGNIGVLWNKPTATIYIRPQRYTKKFLDKFDYFTLSFFEEKYRQALTLCGTKSGKDIDKIKTANLTTIELEKSVSFKEASFVLVCKKLYVSKIERENFKNKKIIDLFYENSDFHFLYIAEILSAFKN